MTWLDTLKDFWWLGVTLLAVLGAVWRTAIKTNRLLEQVKTIEENRKEIQTMKRTTPALEKDIADMRKALDDHVVDQKADIQSINEALFNILDILKDIKSSPEIKEAHNKLRKRQLER